MNPIRLPYRRAHVYAWLCGSLGAYAVSEHWVNWIVIICVFFIAMVMGHDSGYEQAEREQIQHLARVLKKPTPAEEIEVSA